jgi:Zn-dependent protease with chaperone function
MAVREATAARFCYRPGALAFLDANLPVVGSAFLTFAFALPAFFLLEGWMDEDLGALLFGVSTLLLLGAEVFRAVTAQSGASRIVAEWLKGARGLDADAGQPALKVSPGVPPLLLYGVAAPRVLVSETTVSLLTPMELRAVRHENGHMQSRDCLT